MHTGQIISAFAFKIQVLPSFASISKWVVASD